MEGTRRETTTFRAVLSRLGTRLQHRRLAGTVWSLAGKPGITITVVKRSD